MAGRRRLELPGRPVATYGTSPATIAAAAFFRARFKAATDLSPSTGTGAGVFFPVTIVSLCPAFRAATFRSISSSCLAVSFRSCSSNVGGGGRGGAAAFASEVGGVAGMEAHEADEEIGSCDHDGSDKLSQFVACTTFFPHRVGEGDAPAANEGCMMQRNQQK